MSINNAISFLISIHYYMILYHIILHIGYVYFHCYINFLRVCFWSTTGGAQLVETNIKCFSSTTSAAATTSAITNTSIYVWIYLY